MSDAVAGNLAWPVGLLIALVVLVFLVVTGLRIRKARLANALVVIFEQRPTYLHAIVTGRLSTANVWRYLEQIMQECRARNCYRVLVEERLEGPRLGAAEVFKIASQGSARFFGLFEAAAFVDVYQEGPLMDFAELVATNRGLPVAVFATVAEAEQWLLAKKQDVETAPASALPEMVHSQVGSTVAAATPAGVMAADPMK